MRGAAVVVVAVGSLLPVLSLGACEPPRAPQGEHCAAFVACYLTPDDDGLTGFERLGQSDGDATACYGGFDSGDVAPLLATMRRAYGEDGSCWTGGYGSVTGRDDEAVAATRRQACADECRFEVAAECGRRKRGELSVCPDVASVADACAAFEDDGDPVVDDLTCDAVDAAEGDAAEGDTP